MGTPRNLTTASTLRQQSLQSETWTQQEVGTMIAPWYSRTSRKALNNKVVYSLTVRLLESGTGTASTVLLRFATTGVTDEESSIVVKDCLFEVVFWGLVNVLGVVRDDGLGNGCPNGVNLCGDTSTLHSDADIEVGELVLSKDKNGFEDLQSHDLGLDVLNRLSIHLDETPSLFREGDRGGRLFPENCKKRGRTGRKKEKLVRRCGCFDKWNRIVVSIVYCLLLTGWLVISISIASPMGYSWHNGVVLQPLTATGCNRFHRSPDSSSIRRAHSHPAFGCCLLI